MKIVNKFLTYSESYYKNNKSGVYSAFVRMLNIFFYAGYVPSGAGIKLGQYAKAFLPNVHLSASLISIRLAHWLNELFPTLTQFGKPALLSPVQ